MCLTHLAGEFRWGPKFKLFTSYWVNLNNTLLNCTMDPEPLQDPMEGPTPAPEPMMMERSRSSESGSNSSLSTTDFTKKSGSISSSRSGSASSTSRSPPHQEVATRLQSWPSPSFGQGQGQDQGHGEDDQSSRKISVHSPEKEKNDTDITKGDSTGAFDHPQQHDTKVIQELQKSSDTIVKEFRHTETVLIKEAEEAADICCSCCRPGSACCRSGGAWGICGDIAAVLCCPFTVISLLSCICFKCPKMFANKTAKKVKSVKSRGKGEHTNREESEFEESTDTTAKEVSPSAIVNCKDGRCEGHHDKKPEVIATTTSSKGRGFHTVKKGSPIESHRNYFFPSPEVEDDRPGGDKSGGR